MKELKNNIIKQLTSYKNSWQNLTDHSNECLNNRIVAMTIAINIVEKEFEKIRGDRNDPQNNY